MKSTIKTADQIGAVLRGYRRDQGLTQADLARRVGLAQNAISEIETGAGRSSWARIFKVLSALELDLTVESRGTAKNRRDW